MPPMPLPTSHTTLIEAFHRLMGGSEGAHVAFGPEGALLAATAGAEADVRANREALEAAARAFLGGAAPALPPWPGPTGGRLHLQVLAGAEGTWLLGSRLEAPPVAEVPDLIDLLPLGLTILDAKGTIQATNAASEAILGVPREAQIGRRLSAFPWQLLGEDAQVLSLEQLRTFAYRQGGHHPETLQLGVLRAPGEILWLELAAQQLPSGGVMVTYQDISYWRTMMEANLRMDSMLRSALELGQMGCFLLRDGAPEWVRNAALLGILERNPEVTRRFWSAVADHQAAPGFAFEFEVPASGSEPERWLACRGEPVGPGGSASPLWVGLVQDITQLRREYALARVRAIAQAKSRMAGYLAHEVNNPLAGLRNAALLIRRAEGSPEKQARYLDLMDQGITRIQGVVRALAELNREMGPGDTVPVDELVQELQSLVTRALQARDLILRCEVDPDLRLAASEAEVVRQVMFNLLMNGIEASPKGGTLTLTSALGPGGLELTLQDEGPGVPEDLREAIWGVGFSTKRSTITGGLTPGLALSRTLLRDLGGDLELRPGLPGQGAAFSIRLPSGPMGSA